MEIYNGTYCVYIHTNKTNGKMYVGQTSAKPEIRWQNGLGYRQCVYFYKAIKKYGWDGFEHDVVASHLTKDEADNFEKLLIEYLDTMNPIKGYNLKSGGHNNSILSELVKRKIGASNKGKERTKEHIEAMRQARLGKIHTEKTKRKMSVSHMSKRFAQYENMVVAQYDKNGKLVSIYDTVIVASQQTNINTNAIRNCLIDRSKSAGGYMWKYVDKKCILNEIDAYNTYPLLHLNKPREKNKNRGVLQYNKNGSFIREWCSMTDAANELGIGVNNIWKCCNNIDGRKSAGGFLWAYQDTILTTQND